MSEESGSRSRYHIGMRNVKTGLSVLLCLLFYRLTGQDGYFLACTTAIICMQDSLEKSVHSGLNRLIGTGFGAFLGTLLLYLDLFFHPLDLTIFSAVAGTMLLILLCNAVGKPDAIVISCVVLLVIVLQQTDLAPVVYGVKRFADTTVGIVIAIAVNRFVRKPDPEEPQPPAQPEQASQSKSEAGPPPENETHAETRTPEQP